MKYWAYISYSHSDERVVRRLHRRLESFRVPKALRAREIAGLTVGDRLRPVFRDRDELASAGDLRRSLDTALGQSGALIVVCSPAAARSRWVNEEIRAYIALRGTGRVFPLIIDGEPGSGDDRECFPPALKEAGMEPIAGDLRRHADGPNDGVLKIIAGLLETGFDSLKRRDVQRRNRQAFGIASLAGLIAIATSVMAVYAIGQRDLAELRRGQAEDLITFMLGDLRSRLTEVGRLDILDAVGEKAEAYFGALPPSEIDDETLIIQARALRQIGEVRLEQGQHEQAQRSFHGALEQLRELARRHPDDPGVLFDLAQAQFWAGASHHRALERTAARELFEDYAASARRMVELAPENRDYRIEQAYAVSNLGTLALEQRDLDSALAAFNESGAIFQTLAEQDPGDAGLQFELAANESWLAAVHEASFDWRQALPRRQQAARLHQAVSQITSHPFHRRIESEAWAKLATCELALGHTDAAAGAIGQARAVIGQLAELDPGNREWQINGLEAGLRARLIDAQRGAADLDPDAVTGDLGRIRALASDNAADREWSGLADGISLDLAHWLWLQGHSEIARGLIERAAPTLRAAFRQAPDDGPTLDRYLHFTVLAHGLRLPEASTDDPAASAWLEVQARPRLALEFAHHAALLAGMLGHAAEFRRLSTAIDQAGYREPAYRATLQRLDGS